MPLHFSSIWMLLYEFTTWTRTVKRETRWSERAGMYILACIQYILTSLNLKVLDLKNATVLWGYMYRYNVTRWSLSNVWITPTIIQIALLYLPVSSSALHTSCKKEPILSQDSLTDLWCKTENTKHSVVFNNLMTIYCVSWNHFPPCSIYSNECVYIHVHMSK